MRKILAIALCFATALTLISCKNAESPVTPPAETTVPSAYAQYAGIVADPKSWVEAFEALPIANESMTTDELRQLACDAFKANLTFHWTPTTDLAYTYKLGGNYTDVSLPAGQAYSGMMYAAGISNGSCGTLYKVLPYYDKATGALDTEAMGDKLANILTSNCSYGAMYGWDRVSNSHGLKTMGSYNQFDSNILLVGPYTYEASTYREDFGSSVATAEIIAKNGDQIMYESYAAMLPADGLYSSPSWHVMMCSAKPVIVRNEADGTIDGAKSYLLVHEQGASGTNNVEFTQKQSNNVDMRFLGTVDQKYTFKELLKKGYIPFTLKEFVGEDPIEAGEAWLGTSTEVVEAKPSMTMSELFSQTLRGNYVICNVEIVVKDAAGKVLLSYDPGLMTSPRSFSVKLQDCLDAEKLAPLATGENTICIYARLANGELVEAYQTILKAD